MLILLTPPPLPLPSCGILNPSHRWAHRQAPDPGQWPHEVCLRGSCHGGESWHRNGLCAALRRRHFAAVDPNTTGDDGIEMFAGKMVDLGDLSAEQRYIAVPFSADVNT